ncbi:MAG TPA: DNA gyrase inhibitor YacG [Caulobacteraceae bacterium]|jgi:hypothetical protein|nr:DNA gyrase inhibitor YacG [Caulobacteraceae bacterium]
MSPAVTSPVCPICSKPQDPAYRPFCSRHCADVDLNRWLTGRYSIDGPPEDEEGEGQGARASPDADLDD